MSARCSGNIRDLANDVRERLHQIGHAAALVVDDDKIDIVRMIGDCHRENPRLQQFTLTGTGRSGQQSVRAVCLIAIQHV